MKTQTSENRSGFIGKASKIVYEWNSYLETFSRPQVLGNICFSKQIFYRKQSLGAHVILLRVLARMSC